MKKLCLFLVVIALVLPAPVSAGPASVIQTGAQAAPWIAISGWNTPLYLVHPDGGGRVEISVPGASAYSNYTNLRWSPDGTRLAFSVLDSQTRQASIWLFNPTGGALEAVVQGSSGGFDWYPDGSAILYDRYARQTQRTEYNFTCPGPYYTDGAFRYDGLYRYDLAAKTSTLVIPPPGKYPLLNPVFSPDGKFVLFQQHIFDSPRAYYNAYPQFVAALDSPGRVTSFPDTLSDCSWTPGGQAVTCGVWNESCGMDQRCPVAEFSLQGAQSGQLPAGAQQFDIRPLWSPAGDTVVYASASFQWFGDGPCGGGSQPVDYPDANKVILSASPFTAARELVAGIALGWSPGGSHILVSLQASELTGEPGISVFSLDGVEQAYLGQGYWAAWQPVAAPVPIQDLGVKPENPTQNHAYPVLFEWTSPGNPFQKEPAAHEFEIRYRTDEFSESNWESSPTLASYQRPSVPGESLSHPVDLPRELLNQDLYFAMKSKGEYSGWSELSNTVRYVDAGFRPGRDGYNFSNSDQLNGAGNQWGRYPVDAITLNDFTAVDMVRMFGDKVCQTPVQEPADCVLKWRDALFMQLANEQISENGHCLGMSSTSLLAWANPHNLALFSPSAPYLADKTINLSPGPTRNIITYYSVMQLNLPFLTDTALALTRADPQTLLEQTRAGLVSGDYQVIVIAENEFPYSGRHAVTPFALSQSGGKMIIYYYDNVYPGNIVTIPMAEDSQAFTGQRRAIAFPVLNVTGSFSPVWDEYQVYAVSTLAGAVLLENDSGQQTGTRSGQPVNEIPGGIVYPWMGNLEAELEPLYLLPSDDAYLLQLRGSQPTAGSPVKITYLAPDAAALLSGVNLPPDARVEAGIAPDGSRLRLLSTTPQELDLTLAATGEQGLTVTLTGVDLQPGQPFELILDGSQTLSITQAGAGEYELEFSEPLPVGESAFAFGPIPSQPGEVHHLLLKDPSGAGGSLRLQVDRDGDRKADQEIELNPPPAGTGAQQGAARRFPAASLPWLVGVVAGFVLAGYGGISLLRLRGKDR